MIITKQKPIAEILSYLKEGKKVFLLGCALCASVCKTGGEDQLKEIESLLQKEGRIVTGRAVLDPACNLLEIKRLLRKQKDQINASDAILSFACGGGTQAIIEIVEEKEVFPGNDTLFQGEITKLTLKEAQFERKCSLCGECMLAATGNICPVTRCPKGLLNGPCGGIKNGKCEVDSDMNCIWLRIYNRLNELGRLSEMKKTRPPKDHSKNKRLREISTK